MLPGKAAIPSNGGLPTARNSRLSLVWLVISLLSLVRAVPLSMSDSPGTAAGSSVAVERIFSGGRDTISLRRASLKPDMIRTLMLLKNRLRLARVAIDDMLGD